MGLAHLRVAGEEAEGAALGDLEDAADALGGLLLEVGLARVGHVWREVEQRLLRVVEVAGDDELAAWMAEARRWSRMCLRDRRRP